jgi:hypothetical protein
MADRDRYAISLDDRFGHLTHRHDDEDELMSAAGVVPTGD